MNYLNNILITIQKSSPKLYTIAILHFVLALACIVGLLIDDRTLMGVNVWIKPLKFCISGSVFILTVGLLTAAVYPYSKKRRNLINNLTSWTLLFEILIIVFQAARGVQSHYNQASLFDGLLFAAMGILVGINVVIMVAFLIDTMRLKLSVGKSTQIALFMGWLVVLFGSWVGGQMIGQMGHNVGVADGGAGLPLVNWSTIAGDLRIAHFFGLHGIQIIPLFAVWLSHKWKASNQNHNILVALFGLLYISLIGFTFYQAKQGMPFIQL